MNPPNTPLWKTGTETFASCLDSEAGNLLLPALFSHHMKGNEKVIEALNEGLTLELTAVNQYFVQAKMCKIWGYHKLAKKHRAESLEEMRHAELLVDRILFLGGIPNISRYDVIRVGKNVPEHFDNDLKLELKSVEAYNRAVALCHQVKDAGSRDLLAMLLKGSEEHVEWLEAQRHIMQEVGLENYLPDQTGDEDTKD